MLSIYKILGIDLTTAAVGIDLQAAYDGILARYHPEDHPEEVQALSLFLRDGDRLENKHKIDSLQALERLAEEGLALPRETLDIVSSLLLDFTQPELHEACARLLACYAGNEQLLPDNTIRILEAVLGYGEGYLVSIVAAALNAVLNNDQPFTPLIVEYTESAFIRQQDPLVIGTFLYQLITQLKPNGLSQATYAALCEIILDSNQSRQTQNQCYNILAASARQGHDLPSNVLETLTRMLLHPELSVREKAFYVVLTCLAEEKNRLAIPQETLINLINHTEHALLLNHPKINQYAACILGHLILEQRNELDEWLQLRHRLDIKHNPNIQQNLVVGFLEKTLENPQIRHYAIKPLYYFLGQGKYGLLSASRLALHEMTQAPNINLELKQTAIVLMGLSLRNTGNVFSSEELKALELISQQSALTQSGLKALGHHVTSLNNLDRACSVSSSNPRTPLAFRLGYITEKTQATPVLSSVVARSVDELLEKLKANNETNPQLLPLLMNDTFLHQLDAIFAAAQNDSVLQPIEKSINDWNVTDCFAWAKCLKSQPEKAHDSALLPEIIAVISRGNELTNTHKPRAAQLFSLLILLDAKEKGRLAEIATGEGKSTIVAMLAAIKALQGNTVDVVSSSPLLAFRDAEEKADFFKLFDLTVACNWEPHADNSMRAGFKACYAADIVYGDANNFQFDLLRHEYKQENTRGERQYETVIVDEVDSMLIDESSKIASLGSYKPLMSELDVLFVSAWIALCQRKELMQKDDFQLPINEKTGFLYTKTNYLRDVVEQVFVALLDGTNTLAHIPKHLHAYALSQAPYWAKSAVLALENYVLGQDYVITGEGEHAIIAPVDYLNTGVIHPNSAWDDGLQQFLQLKHHLKLTAENLTASFISNRAYFKRYEKTIYGLTGTLGANDSQSLLQTVYDVDLAFIPTYQEKQLETIPGELVETAEEWLAKIVANVKQEAEKGRAALVICECINTVHRVEAALRLANINKIKCYTRSDNDEISIVAGKVASGDVIIATNLAGRGTDIKTSVPVEESGGLYVCVTFLPKNLRIEEQAFGRTARQGRQGSAQLVINKREAVQQLSAFDPDFDLGDADSIENIKKWRDAVEAQSLQIVKEYELPKLIFKDKLFTEFCAVTGALRRLDDNEVKLDEVEEQWGFWLKRTLRKIADVNPLTDSNETEILNDLECFKAEINAWFVEQTLQNPSAWVKFGIDKGNTEEAKIAYEQAIEHDSQSLAALQAHYRLAHLHIAAKNKQAAIVELEIARKLLTEQIMPRLEAAAQLPLFYQKTQANQKIAANIQQSHNRIHLLKIQQGYIERDLTVLKNARRPIESTGFNWLGHFFNDNNRPRDEINELQTIGLPHLFEIREAAAPKKKKKGFGAWIRRAVVAVVGVCQIVAGACLTLAGSVNWGSALIEMGVSDILLAVRSAIEGTACTFADYRAHKIVSTAITLATMGIGILRHGSNAAVKEAGKRVTQQTVTLQIRHSIQMGVLREGLHFGMSAAAKGLIADYKEELRNRIRNTLMARFNQPDFQQAIDAILAVDRLNGNNQQAMKLQQIAFAIIEPKRNAFARMSEAIIKGVAANLSPGLGVVMKAQDIARAIDKMGALCDDFCDELLARLPLLVHQLPSLPAGQSPNSAALSQSRAHLYRSLIGQLTQCIMGNLRHEVVTPMLDYAFTERLATVMTKTPTALEPFNLSPSLSINAQIKVPKTTLTASESASVLGEFSRKASLVKLPENQSTAELVRHAAMKAEWEIVTPLNHTVTAMRQFKKPDDFFQRTDFSALDITPIFFNESCEIDFLYRGTGRKPTDIFEQGFKARGKNTSLRRHVIPSSDASSLSESAYISTSTSKQVATRFPTSSSSDRLFLYKINSLPDAILVETALHPERHTISSYDWETIVLYEKEKAVPYKIHPKDIQGAWPIRLSMPYKVPSAENQWGYLKRELDHTFIKNPNYHMPKSVLIVQSVKTLGHIATAVGVVMDGIEWYQAYQVSQESGNYHLVKQTSARLTGGWSGAFAVGSQFARMAAPACTVFGAYGPPVCGVIGGISGSVLGYTEGSAFGSTVYNAVIQFPSTLSAVTHQVMASSEVANLTDAVLLTPFCQSPAHFAQTPVFQRAKPVNQSKRAPIRFFDTFFIPSAEAAESPSKSMATKIQ